MWKLPGYLLIAFAVMQAHADTPAPFEPSDAELCDEPEYHASPNDRQYAARLSPLVSAADWKNLELQAEAIVKQEPEDFLAWSMLGIARQGLGDAEGAIKAFEEAAYIRPDASVTRALLGDAYKQAGRYAEARGAYYLAFLCIHTSQLLIEIADVHIKLNEYEDAALAYSVLSSWNPGDFRIWMQSILAYTLANNPQAAAESLARLKQASPAAARCVTRLMKSGSPCVQLNNDPDCAEALGSLNKSAPDMHEGVIHDQCVR
jgi:tetratricopeptide (TPR) repeat protein